MHAAAELTTSRELLTLNVNKSQPVAGLDGVFEVAALVLDMKLR